MRFRIVLLSLTVAALATFARVTPAFADYQSHPLYQITISENCNNPTYCGQFLGGFWGWAVFNVDGSADAQLTFCGHVQRNALKGVNGAGHFSVDADWFIGKNGNFWTRNEKDTFVGKGGSNSTFTASAQDTDIPSKPGHYRTSDIFGFTAPGVSGQVQVVLIPQNGKFSSAGGSSSTSAGTAVGTGQSVKLSGAAIRASMVARGLVLTRFGWVRMSTGPRLVQ